MSRMKADGYVPIPDVEVGGFNESPTIVLTSPTDLVYPHQASEEEAELLMILDECINSPRIVIDLRANYNEDDVTTTLSPRSGITFILPLLTTMAVLLVGTIVMNTTRMNHLVEHHSINNAYLPYVSTTLLWLASAISIRNRIMGQLSFFVMDRRIALMPETMLETTMNKIVHGMSTQVNTVKSKLSNVLVIMQKKISGLSSNRNSTITTIDHHHPSQHVVPDLSAVGKALDGASDEIGSSANTVKKTVAMQCNYPNYFQSTTNYINKIVIPIVLMICLLLQLGTTFFSILYTEGILRNNTNQVDMSWRILEEKNGQNKGMTATINDNSEAWIGEVFETSQEMVLEQTWPYYTMVYCQSVSFGMALFQIGLVYIFTGPSFVAGFVNDVYQTLSESANQVAESVGFSTVAHSIMHDKMLIIKTQLLQAIFAIIQMEKGEENRNGNPGQKCP